MTTIQALVVDNNPVLLKAISAIVEQEGPCHVRTAEDGLQALESLKLFKPDIVFTDLVMPLVDGELLCKIIRHNRELDTTRIVIVTGVPLEECRPLLDKMDCDFSIAKGSLKEIRRHIREVFKQLRHKGEGTAKRVHSSAEKNRGSTPAQTITTEILNEKKHREEIVAYLSEGVVEMSDQGKIVEINNAALDILALKKEQVIGSTIDSLEWGAHTENIADWLQCDLLGKRAKPLYINDKNPVFRQGKVLTTTLHAIDGTTYFALCIVRDITRLYQAEQYKKKLDHALRLARKMEAMSGMAGGVAHDFNNLLTILCGNLDMAGLVLAEGGYDKVDYLLDQARMTAQAAVTLVTKISHFSPYGIISREINDVHALLQTATQTFRGPRNVVFSMDVEHELLPVSIDREQMVTALHNVFTNCAEAGNDTDIFIRAGKLILKQPLVEYGKYVPAGNYVLLSIQDNGRGIETAHLVDVFNPYFSTKRRGKEKGMGLGLAVVYSTLRNHGGYVTVDSVVEQGTTVSFYIPLAEQPIIDHLPQIETVQPVIRKILLLEDDMQSRQVAGVMFEYVGVNVENADDSSEATEMLRKNTNESERFSAILINLRGDDPEAGLQTCQELKLVAPDIPVIAICGASIHPPMNIFGPSGFLNLLLKPYTIDDLKNLMLTLH